jgi:hypothetical protein
MQLTIKSPLDRIEESSKGLVTHVMVMKVGRQLTTERKGAILLIDVQIKGITGTRKPGNQEQWTRKAGIDRVFDHNDLRCR